MTAAIQRDVRILADAAAIARRAADHFVDAANKAVAARGVFTVALSGGSTPRALYTLLADDSAYRSKIPWDKLRLFFGDERHVPPDHADSNYRMANDTLFSKGVVKPEQVFRIKAELDAEQAALDYEQSLRSFFKLSDAQLPRFDLVYLGMGDEGHTLSLFPGTRGLHPAANRFVIHNWVGKFYTERITLTFPAANNAAEIVLMITKPDKALALKGVLEGPYEPEQLPVQSINPVNGHAIWLVDRDAAKLLTVGVKE